jgi:hypothetical protein
VRTECDAPRRACDHRRCMAARRRICSAPCRADEWSSQRPGDGGQQSFPQQASRERRAPGLAREGAQRADHRQSAATRYRSLSSFDRHEPLPEGGFDNVSVCRGQRVLGRKVHADPVSRLIRGFEIAQFCDQSVSPLIAPPRARSADARWRCLSGWHPTSPNVAR